MKDWKRWLACLTAALMMLGCLPAAAEGGGPTNPYFYEARLRQRRQDNISVNLADPNALSVKFSSESGAYFTEETVWTFTASGGDGNYTYQYYLYTSDQPDGDGYVNTHGYQSFAGDAAFRYQLMTPDKYTIQATVKDGTGATASTYYSFTAQSDAVTSTSQKVAQLAQECLDAGCQTDYEKALWLHEWLTHNARYDKTYSFYSADGVLLRGTGVCDSYSKAYKLLLTAVGIPCVRSIGGNHAWCAVQMDGKWYQIDPTWDDPIITHNPEYIEPAVSGGEQHLYFGLTDEVMLIDHIYTPSADRPCDSWDDNYFVQSGQGQEWADALKAQVESGLDAGNYQYSVDLPTSYRMDGSNEHASGVYGAIGDAVSAALLPKTGFVYEDDEVDLDVSVSVQKRTASVRMNFENATEYLPLWVRQIGAFAFQGAGFQRLVIPDGVTSIGENAFQGCGRLWLVSVPESVTAIADTAFDTDNTHLTIRCAPGSAAETYAIDNGIKYEAE